MNRLIHNLGLRGIKLLNILFMVIPFAICWYTYYSGTVAIPYLEMKSWAIVGLFILLYVIFARIYDAFLVSLYRISEMVYSQALAAVFSDVIMFIVIWLLSKQFPNMLPGLAALAAQLAIAALWSFVAQKIYYRMTPPKKTIVIYGQRSGMENLIQEYDLEKKFDILNTVEITNCLKNLDLLSDAEAVFISGVESGDRNDILKYCVEQDKDVYLLPCIGDIIMSGSRRMHLFHLPVMRVGRYNPRPEYTFVKRMFDIISSAAVLLVISPVMLVTAIAIKATDGGPVFYKQKRLTKDGKIFNVLKFRSMRVDAEKDGVARLSTGDKDDRITPVGRVIRKLRIDELPQLLNILGGSMSVVGPRPERPEIAQQYEEDLPEFRLRLQMKAGLTGYAQVYGKYNTTPYDKLQMDLMYIARPTFFEDLKIIFATIKIIFLPESTDGIAEGQTTAAVQQEQEQERERELQNV